MFKPSKDKLRHKILLLLHEKLMAVDSGVQVLAEDMSENVEELAKRLNMTPSEFVLLASPLQSAREIEYEWLPSGEGVRLGEMGAPALSSNKYRDLAAEKRRKKVDNWLKLTAVASLFLGLINTFNSCNASKRNTSRIEQLQQRLSVLKARQQTISHPVKIADSLSLKQP